VPLIPTEVFFVNDEIVIGVQLPKSAVEHVKMLVTEKLPDFIYVIFGGHCVENRKQITVFKISECYFSIVIHIQGKENSHYHSVSISVLKLRGSLQKLQSWVGRQ